MTKLEKYLTDNFSRIDTPEEELKWFSINGLALVVLDIAHKEFQIIGFSAYSTVMVDEDSMLFNLEPLVNSSSNKAIEYVSKKIFEIEKPWEEAE